MVRHGFDGNAPPAEPVPPCVDVVVVAYNSAADLPAVLASLPAAAGDVAISVTVVDNASPDESAQVAAAVDGVRVLRSGVNLGYAGAINLARRRTATPGAALLVLNPDLVLDPGCVPVLLARLADPSVGVVVPRLLDGDGEPFPSLRREPSVLRALGDALLGAHWPGRPAWAGETVLDPGAYGREADVDWATGAALLVSPTCEATVGPWDERFFLYSEETDYARRVRAAGLAVRYVPDAVARHRGGGSGSSPALMALLAVNKVRYVEKHSGAAAAAAFRGVGLLNELLRLRRPGHAEVMRTLRDRRRWDGLPSAPLAPEPARPVDAAPGLDRP